MQAISASAAHFKRVLSHIHFLAVNFRGQLYLLIALQRGQLSLFFFIRSVISFFSPNCLFFIHADNLLEIENALLSLTGHLFSQRVVF